MLRFDFRAVAGAALLLAAPALLADNSTKIPGYTIHHNVVTTDVLTPTVASTYGIRRSKNRAMLNVSVIKDATGAMGKSVKADVKADIRNLIGQSRELPMREIREGDAYYYIGDFLVSHRERLQFILTVKPADGDQTFGASLSQEFYTD